MGHEKDRKWDRKLKKSIKTKNGTKVLEVA